MYAPRIGATPPRDVPGVIAVVQTEFDKATNQYPLSKTKGSTDATSNAIQMMRDGDFAKWKARGQSFDASTADDAYAKWTQLGKTYIDALHDIEGIAKEGTFSWVVTQTLKQSAVDAANLAAKGGQTLLDTGKALFSWKGVVVIAAAGLGVLFVVKKAKG